MDISEKIDNSGITIIDDRFNLSDSVHKVVLFAVAHGNVVAGRVESWNIQNLLREISELGKLNRPIHVHLLVPIGILDDVRGLEISLAESRSDIHIHSDYMNLDDWNNYSRTYEIVYRWLDQYSFDLKEEVYFADISSGTAVMRACVMQMVTSGVLPGKAIQADMKAVIVLDIRAVNRAVVDSCMASRHGWQSNPLAYGRISQHATFEQIDAEVSIVAKKSDAPILLLGDTGVGKTRLAKNIYTEKKKKMGDPYPLVQVNCATITGDGAMSALFGHVKGAFTGAEKIRQGYLKKADGGVLFLDEIGELGLEEQAMLLLAIETGIYYPVGSDAEVTSKFALIAGTNRELSMEVEAGRFRRDLYARLSTWKYRLPSLSERKDDIEKNLDLELTNLSTESVKFQFYPNAKEKYLEFAKSDVATWPGNFRELIASVGRMATLSESGFISVEMVEREIDRLKDDWLVPALGTGELKGDFPHLLMLKPKAREEYDPVNCVQLDYIISVCARSKNKATAARELFAVWHEKAKAKGKSFNPTTKLDQILKSFDLKWEDIHPKSGNSE